MSSTDVAVLGIGCRLPGGVDSPARLWQALLRGEDAITEIPADRWDVEEHYAPEVGAAGASVSRWGGFLDDVGGFDSAFFGLGDREARAMDPQHRLLLETSWEAVESSGLPPSTLAGHRTGVFLGQAHDDYALIGHDTGNLEGPYGFAGNASSMASGRIAYALALTGPAVTLDSSCSSGLLSVHLACQSLQKGETDTALAGGCMVMLVPEVSASASAQGMLSPTGRCRAFDASADGFVRSEGCVVIFLKRLEDARRDGDRVLAVVRGSATNQDGRTGTITEPSRDAQVSVYEAALRDAGVEPGTVGLVEAHGTGTPVGDPIEFTGLREVYGREGRCAVGSAKTNFGHTEAAAGALGLAKAVLALLHGTIPRNLHFTEFPEALRGAETGLFVPDRAEPWPARGNTPRRAVVSSFGMSGTNVHAVLEQAPETAADSPPPSPGEPESLFFPVSSTSVEELRTTARRLAEWAEESDGRVAARDVAYTLARRREHRSVRAVALAPDLSALAGRLRELADDGVLRPIVAPGQHRGPVLVFSGHGSQWAGMGRELLAREPGFAAAVAEAEPLIAREAGFSVTEAMCGDETVTGMERVQPVLFAVQLGLAAALRAHGVVPGGVIGHSMGEVGAAVVAGALSLEDGVRVICRRSALCARIAGTGAMASVELPAEHVRAELAGQGLTDVGVAVVASPHSTVLSGARETVRRLVRSWEGRGVPAHEVQVEVASHSPQVDPVLDPLAECLDGLAPKRPAVPFFSTCLQDPLVEPEFGPDYWVDNLRQPVRFMDAVRAALEDGHRVFAELSPHPLLARAVEQTAEAEDNPAETVVCMRRDMDLPNGLLPTVAALHCAGAAVDFAAVCPDGRLVDAPLPSWTHRQLMFRTGEGPRHTGAAGEHPLLGSHVRLPEAQERHAWQGDVGTGPLPWLSGHQVGGVPVLPGAAYCEMALSAAHVLFGESACVHDLTFEDMLLLDEHTPLSVTTETEAPEQAAFAVHTMDGQAPVRRAAARLRGGAPEEPLPRDVSGLRAGHTGTTEGDVLRRGFGERGVVLGSAFSGLARVHLCEDTSTLLAELALPAALHRQQSAYVVHPALLDACFQSAAAYVTLVEPGRSRGLFLPLGVEHVSRHGPLREARYCVTEVTAADERQVTADLDVVDEYGSVLLCVRGIRMGSAGTDGRRADALRDERLMTVSWSPRQLGPGPSDDAAGHWLVISDEPLGEELAAALRRHVASCAVLRSVPRSTEEVTGLDGVVYLAPAPHGLTPDTDSATRGREQVRQLVRAARLLPDLTSPPRLYVVTRAAQHVLDSDQISLDQAGLRGLVRTLAVEHPGLRASQIDLEAATTEVSDVVRELLCGGEEDETAWRGGVRYAARLHSAPFGPEERHRAPAAHADDGVRLRVRVPGDPGTLEPTAHDRRPPGPGRIEVAVTAASVNFVDVLNVLGRGFGEAAHDPELGVDFAGTVAAVGEGVTGHRVGDRVAGTADPGTGTWATFVTCDARLAVPLPEDLSDEEGAACAAAGATAWYALHTQGRMAPGERVLIHSATGGLGRAALAVARSAGAEIHATAGSPRRRKVLRELGVKHVYDSRGTEFADRVRDATGGYGVDIVLNSLPGPAQRAGIELLADGGRFLEVGKRDVYENTRLALYPFRRNLSFHLVDLSLLRETHPGLVQELLRTVCAQVAQGILPKPVLTSRPLHEAADAVREMSNAQHDGKLVLRVDRGARSEVVIPPDRVPVLRRDGAYIVTGGLGGLGLFLAQRMAEEGCGRIVLTSRSRPGEEARRVVDGLRAVGTDVEVVCGDIAAPETAPHLVEAACATGLPLRGVLHAAAVVEDATLANITDEIIDWDWAPKAHGIWNLHRATEGHPLDWFCSFSSGAALFGSPGQGAYAAANSWLDAFTHWRRSQGLPAQAIAWGVWAEVGRATALAEKGGHAAIRPGEGADAFLSMLRHTRTYTGYAPRHGNPTLAALAERGPFAAALRSGTSGREHSTLLHELRELPEDERPGRLRRFVSEEAGAIIRDHVDVDRPFDSCGLDSLGTLELRTRIETRTGVRLTPDDIRTHRTARALAHYLWGRLPSHLGGAA
ncbi:sulfolipid-1 biosynthesis phthioceranic/hydroxyphthioceranic acid synthase [Streptomyces cacaoi]|uniref:Multifunctional mycocerosic acid synthase n=1 Tax=Streptomyces cacaoi TaxID=1898 RepID=A0A4Y3QRM5_STRCI|nr:type I polyketide synthase [Streptomyces cacaoi]NNG85513.1 type I polyketide synthase [Streptomyces cacaoi]GEB47945.1 multifunctional mycocerosic acid synthase [Streptomyces cacaoi]